MSQRKSVELWFVNQDHKLFKYHHQKNIVVIQLVLILLNLSQDVEILLKHRVCLDLVAQVVIVALVIAIVGQLFYLVGPVVNSFSYILISILWL